MPLAIEPRELTARTYQDVYLGEIELAPAAALADSPHAGRAAGDRRRPLMAEKICTNIGHGGGPVLVHVEDDKIIRVRPLVFADDEVVPSWTLEARGRQFTPAPQGHGGARTA